MHEIIKLKRGRYSLRRVRDGMGDSGHMLRALDPKTAEQVGENGDIAIGCAVQCGSIYARSYQHQDWWLTTPITEILEISDDKDYVKFKTGNSLYELKVT
jgi:hypothetical protein